MGFSFIFPQKLPAEEFLSSMKLRVSKFGCVRVIEAITEALSLGAMTIVMVACSLNVIAVQLLA